MYGWIICNEFLNSKEKFQILNTRLLRAAEALDIEMELVSNAELLVQYTSNGKKLIGKRAKELDSRRPDFVLFMDKDVELCAAIEEQGIRCFNNSRAIALADNKRMMAAALGDLMPSTVRLPMTFEGLKNEKLELWNFIESELGYPLVVKEEYGSFGMQVYLVQDAQELNEIYNRRGDKGLIVQRFVAESRGRDLRLQVVGNQVVAAMERFNPDDFRANITNGGKMKSYEPSEEEKRLAIDACRALGLDFGGVDLLFTNSGDKLICEVNSNAHIENIYLATGVDISIKILNYVLEMIK